MRHLLERAGLWLTTTVAGIGLLYLAMTAPAETSTGLLGVFYVLGLALLAIGILGFASEVVVAVHGRLPGTPFRSPSAPSEPKAPQPAPEPTRTEARPKLSSITLAPPSKPVQPEPRIFVPPSVTPVSLNAFFEGHTDAQGKRSVADHIDKWMPFQGTVSNVQVFTKSVVVTSYVDPPVRTGLRISIGMWFPESAIEKVGLLAPGDPISVVGRIRTIGHYDIDLHDCELVE